MFVVCAGRPEPSVRWLVNGVLVDEEYEHNTGDVIENRLLWPAVRRADYAAVFTCQAANSHLVPPKELSLVLDMFCELLLCINVTDIQNIFISLLKRNIYLATNKNINRAT